MKRLLIILIILGSCHQGMAQNEGEREVENEIEEELETYHKHVISLGLGHAHISQGVKQNGDKKWLVLPSWMLDYNFWFRENWAIGLHTDMIVENFVVEDLAGEESEENQEPTLEREKPIALVAAVSYKPIEWLSLVAGGGVEYESSESFGLVRFGLEPHMEVGEKWEIFANLSYDLKIDAYDTYSFAIGIGRGF